MVDVERRSGGRSSRRLLTSIVVVLAIVFVDQFTKWLIDERLGPNQTTHHRKIIGEFFTLEYARNRGIAFGLLQGQTIWITIFAMVLLVLGARGYRQFTNVPMPIALGGGLVTGGAIGNLIDRVRLGYVVDFISVGSWPTFNLADSAISFGALLIAWHLFRDTGRTDRPDDVRAFNV